MLCKSPFIATKAMGAVQITALLLVNNGWANITFVKKKNVMAKTKYLYENIFLNESTNYYPARYYT
jgi:isocitrate/isopropylmalate dehydrogenase